MTLPPSDNFKDWADKRKDLPGWSLAYQRLEAIPVVHTRQHAANR